MRRTDGYHGWTGNLQFLGLSSRIEGLGVRIEGLGVRPLGLESSGLRFRVQGLEFKFSFQGVGSVFTVGGILLSPWLSFMFV